MVRMLNNRSNSCGKWWARWQKERSKRSSSSWANSNDIRLYLYWLYLNDCIVWCEISFLMKSGVKRIKVIFESFHSFLSILLTSVYTRLECHLSNYYIILWKTQSPTNASSLINEIYSTTQSHIPYRISTPFSITHAIPTTCSILFPLNSITKKNQWTSKINPSPPKSNNGGTSKNRLKKRIPSTSYKTRYYSCLESWNKRRIVHQELTIIFNCLRFLQLTCICPWWCLICPCWTLMECLAINAIATAITIVAAIRIMAAVKIIATIRTNS